jgi:hypothetical protein
MSNLMSKKIYVYSRNLASDMWRPTALDFPTRHHTILHLFVIPTADYAATLLLRMGKERPKHVELLSF